MRDRECEGERREMTGDKETLGWQHGMEKKDEEAGGRREGTSWGGRHDRVGDQTRDTEKTGREGQSGKRVQTRDSWERLTGQREQERS